MGDDAAPAGGEPTPAHESRRGLGLRLVIALAASAGAGILVDRILADAVPSVTLRALLSAAASASLVGVALFRLVVAPLSRSRTELTVAYHAALADALKDPLTGLGNHRAFQEELDRQVEASQRYEVPLALLLIDLDEFKAINDGRGHAIGDRALSQFGRLTSTTIRRADRAFRIGGDEFAVLLPHTDADGARIVGMRLLAEALEPTLKQEGDVGGLSFSGGIAAIPDAATRAQLYSRADSALYAAKRSGRTDVLVFDPARQPAATDAGSGAAVADVIARGLLRPVYQPIVDLSTRTVLGVEGLIRPIEPAPFDGPASLFEAAAASGHLVALDLSCVEAIAAGAEGLPDDWFLSINLSPATVEAPEFSPPTLLGILARHGIAPSRVVLELTEHQPLTDVDRVRSKLEACRSAGMRLAADDVGAGNAGLRLLSELRFDIVKVDLSLVRRSAGDSPSSAVIESVVSFAARTGALVIGEGIEETSHVDQLLALGVTAGQGYLLGRPASMAAEQEQRPLKLPAARATAAAAHDVVLDEAPMAAWRASIGLPAA
jgi:diguanylate cyclase (GGDEF)-like protein